METGSMYTRKNSPREDIRIVVVENDPVFRRAIEHCLNEDICNRVYTFATGEDCFRCYRQLRPEIMILDYKLNDDPGSGRMNGPGILLKAKSLCPETEIILLPQQQNMEVLKAVIRNGASMYIPRDERTLARIINEVTYRATVIRSKREDLRSNRWLLFAMLAGTGLAFVLYLAGSSFLAGLLIFFLAIGCAIPLVLFETIRKAGQDIVEKNGRKEERPGTWFN